MHDLETIRRLNAEAHADHVQALRKQGKHVVVHYAGLHVLRHEAYDSAEAALAAAKGPHGASERAHVLHALPAHGLGAPVFREVDGVVVEDTLV